MTRLILPGWFGSGPGHWQRLWLEDDPSAIIVEQENWADPDLESWIANLDRALAEHEGATLVAHSLGVVLVAHYASRPHGRRIGAALLVAPGDADLHGPTTPPLASFAPVPRARLPFPSIMVLGTNDPHMSIERSRQLADDLGSEIVELGAVGHINVDSGFGRWPLGHELAEELEHRSKP